MSSALLSVLLVCNTKILKHRAKFSNMLSKVCLDSKFPPTLHSTLEIQPATLFGEKCVRLYLLGYHSLCRF
jgi:hypothetical protein